MPVGVALGSPQPAPQEPVTGGQFEAVSTGLVRGLGGCGPQQGLLDRHRTGGAHRLIGIQEQHPIAAQPGLVQGPIALLGDQEAARLAMLQHPESVAAGNLPAAIVTA